MFEFKEISDDCIKCGKCIPTCTIHEINPDETTSPRGFIELLGAYQDGELELDKEVKDIFESCFLCTNCVEVCPNDLPTDMIIEQVRSDIAKKYGIAWYKRAFFFLLRHRFIMDIMAKLGWVFQTCAIKIEQKTESAVPRFSLPIVKKDRALPFARSKSFLNSYPELIKPKNKKTIPSKNTIGGNDASNSRQELKNDLNLQQVGEMRDETLNNEAEVSASTRVAIFIGCMANYSYTNIGKSLVHILETLGHEIMIPKKQLCCSAPAYFTGDFDTVDYLAKKNIEYFETFIDTVEAIIIPEATCSAMMNIDYNHYFHNQPEWAERAKKLAPKIIMATKWLNDNTKLKELLKQRGQIDTLVTYHDPCHAKKMQGISSEPRDFIKQNYKFTEMSDSNRCCGFGGITMQTEKYDLARRAGMPKAAMIQETKADVVSAECSACRMQITNSLYQAKEKKIVFKNPIELISDALKVPLKKDS